MRGNDSRSGLVSVRKQIAALGCCFNDNILKTTRSLYGPFHRRGKDGVQLTADVVYGPAPRNVLDVFSRDPNNAPVVVFVHGGGFVSGDKSADDPFYSNVGRFFAENGFVAVVINYRLAPNSPWPAGAEDVANAVTWVRNEIAKFDGNPKQVFLIGQSAGACHVASYLFDQSLRIGAERSISAAVLMSGFYLAHGSLSPSQTAYFGSDASLYGARSPITHVGTNQTPLLITIAEFDPAPIGLQSLGLATSLTSAKGRIPPLVRFDGHNHVSTVMSIGTEDTAVSDALLDFFAKVNLQL